ncbi:short-chain dehydrogenase [Brevibacillus sp. GCM10020057]|uniref:short-chain dehydrogenase n=1 Tax=Brevibacillus sp. GCM10020057 TaxID=3317327 RepID=UPI0036274776
MGREALVIGGSGMLAEVSRWLAETGYHVTVVGRDRRRLERVAGCSGAVAPESFTLLPLDYHDTEKLRQALSHLLCERGSIDLVVAWIHSTASEALPAVIQSLARQQREWRLFHVCGSRAWIEPPREPVADHLLYRRIILGFVLEGNESRWLTNEEIAQGVIRAVRADQPSIVGVVEPWEKRPGY